MDVRNVIDGFGERISPDEVRRGLRPDHIARYLFAAHFVSGRSVVDLCCGVGYGANLLFAAGASDVTAIDIDPEAIRVARTHYSGPEFRVARADQPLGISDCDVSVCFEAIEHVDQPEQLIANLRAARVALVSTPNAGAHEIGFSGNPHHVAEWTRGEFEMMLARHFQDVRMYFQWHHPDPLDQDWNLRTFAKAITPVGLKARLRPPPPSQASADSAPNPREYRVFPASYLSVLPPGFRYGTPVDWLAVCRR
jgi:2-polyprenyl-3-methyl-5-hydroxy-6-metoxy-1,4-benzoquinol methylase